MATHTDESIEKIAVEHGSGNVFADLGFEEPDLELAKALLSAKIATEIRERGWTQRQAADVLGIDQPRVSLLVRGRTGQFGLEKLLEMVERLNFDVSISLQRRDTDTRGKVLVAA